MFLPREKPKFRTSNMGYLNRDQQKNSSTIFSNHLINKHAYNHGDYEY
jgi:hypothetical protein